MTAGNTGWALSTSAQLAHYKYTVPSLAQHYFHTLQACTCVGGVANGGHQLEVPVQSGAQQAQRGQHGSLLGSACTHEVGTVQTNYVEVMPENSEVWHMLLLSSWPLTKYRQVPLMRKAANLQHGNTPPSDP